jgi:glycosyltransferase involved in cell wall biosynthesis
MTPRRITLVANELRGIEPVGGLGTATTFLALALARSGHDVDLLHLGEASAQTVTQEWAHVYADAGVRISTISESTEQVAPKYFHGLREIERTLRADPPDVVIAQDGSAPVYSALRLRQLAIAHAGTPFIIFCHGTRGWIKDMGRNVRVFPYLLGLTALERASIELADIVVSPSSYLLEWMREQGWRLPARSLVIPYLTETIAMGRSPQPWPNSAKGLVQRLTFFGRLDERKGIRPFAAGLNALPSDLLQRIELEFLGPEVPMTRDRVEELLSASTRHALRQISFETGLDRHQALSRLRRPGTLAVMPSLEDNSPNTVYECLEHGVPFLASHRGGTAELIAAEDRERVLFEPTADGVEAALRAALQNVDALRPAQAAFDPRDSLRAWEEVVATAAPPRRRASREHPVIDVVVVHRGSESRPSPCLSALDRQSYRHINVINIGVAEHQSPDAARRVGIQAGSAPYVIFLDERDEPDREFVASLVRAQAASGADVVSCGLELRRSSMSHLFLGDSGALGLLSNTYGTSALIRRGLLDDLRWPWPTERDLEWPLLARLYLAGARIVSIPLPLLSRTVGGPSPLGGHRGDELFVVREHERALPDSLRALARLAAGLADEYQVAPSDFGGILRRAQSVARIEGVGGLARRLRIRLLSRLEN